MNEAERERERGLNLILSRKILKFKLAPPCPNLQMVSPVGELMSSDI